MVYADTGCVGCVKLESVTRNCYVGMVTFHSRSCVVGASTARGARASIPFHN